MEREELLRRLQDLQNRCDRGNLLTSTAFLTPAEQGEAAAWLKLHPGCNSVFFGGHRDCERKVLFFLPEYLECLPEEEALAALHIEAAFGAPGHRDYLGALLGQGVRREWLGDIWISGGHAYVFCLPTVAGHLAALEQVGRVRVQAKRIPLSQVAEPERKRKTVSFTVQSLRLDAIAGDMFGLSRTNAAKLIAAGAVSLNYLPCLKPDAPVKEGDVVSLRGYGKGVLAQIGGTSRKGRQFLKAEIFI